MPRATITTRAYQCEFAAVKDAARHCGPQSSASLLEGAEGLGTMVHAACPTLSGKRSPAARNIGGADLGPFIQLPTIRQDVR